MFEMPDPGGDQFCSFVIPSSDSLDILVLDCSVLLSDFVNQNRCLYRLKSKLSLPPFICVDDDNRFIVVSGLFGIIVGDCQFRKMIDRADYNLYIRLNNRYVKILKHFDFVQCQVKRELASDRLVVDQFSICSNKIKEMVI